MAKLNKKTTLNIVYVIGILSMIVLASAAILPTLNVSDKTRFYTVDSGSMAPEIGKGSLIVIRRVEEYLVDDVITISTSDDPALSYTHRITEIIDEEGVISYRTKGDANDSDDTNLAYPENVLGKVTIDIPFLGYLIMFSKTPIGFLLMVIVPATFIIISEVINIRNELKSQKKSKQKNTAKTKEKQPKSKKKQTQKKSIKVSSILIVLLVTGACFSTYPLTKSGFVDTVQSQDNGFSPEKSIPSKESVELATEPIDQLDEIKEESLTSEEANEPQKVFIEDYQEILPADDIVELLVKEEVIEVCDLEINEVLNDCLDLDE